MLQQVGIYNDLSKSLIEKLEKKIEGFGKTVRYRFNIENENPDKTFHDGKTIFPNQYTLDPTIFKINDKDDATGKNKSKSIALIKEHKYNDRNQLEFVYRKIRVKASQRGIVRLNLENDEDVETCMYLELHPKLANGEFGDKERVPVFKRVDENAEAVEKTQERSERLKAQITAQGMTEEQILQFCDAMQLDSTRELVVLRNDVEELADTDPSFFNDLVGGKKLEYQALAKKAVDMSIIIFDPASYSFTWVSNNHPIVALQPVGDKNEIQKLGEWLMIGDKGQEVFKKLKSLVGNKKELTV